MSATPKIYDTDEMNRWVDDAIKDGLAVPYDPAERMAMLRRKQIMERMVEFKELLMMNACAIKEITKEIRYIRSIQGLRVLQALRQSLKNTASHSP